MDAGQLLRESRLRHGLTQKQLAIRARTSQAAISRIERGLVSPTVETLQRLLAMVNEELELSVRPIPVSINLDVMHENLSLIPSERIEQGAFLSNLLRGTQVLEMAEDVRPTLHAEIARILHDHGNRRMKTTEIAAAVNDAGRYAKRDGSAVTDFQIHGRTKNYPELFERDGAHVRLAEIKQDPQP